MLRSQTTDKEFFIFTSNEFFKLFAFLSDILIKTFTCLWIMLYTIKFYNIVVPIRSNIP